MIKTLRLKRGWKTNPPDRSTSLASGLAHKIDLGDQWCGGNRQTKLFGQFFPPHRSLAVFQTFGFCVGFRISSGCGVVPRGGV